MAQAITLLTVPIAGCGPNTFVAIAMLALYHQPLSGNTVTAHFHHQ